MLSRLTATRSRFTYLQMRSFAAINASNVNLEHVTANDIKESSTSVVGAVVVALAHSNNVHADLCHEIDEHFRTNFRKVSFEDAKNIIVGLGSNEAKLIQGLDEKFWVWETLEEAARPHVSNLNKEEINSFHRGMTIQLKGSEDFHDVIQFKYARHFAPQPDIMALFGALKSKDGKYNQH